MTDSNRRRFLIGASAVVGATALPAVAESPDIRNHPAPAKVSRGLLHNVYFWLKNPDSTIDRDKLIDGLKTLTTVPSVRSLHIGVPAPTEQRGVVDSSFQVSETLMFDDVAGQNAYQEHPVHKQFVADCEHLWQRVVVYDSLLV